MKKRIFCILMVMLMIGNLAFYAVAEEKNVTMLHNCDTAFGGFVVENDAQRGRCLALHFNGQGRDFANSISFSPINAKGCDTLVMEVYVSEPAMISNIKQMYVEITSSGTCDQMETAWAAHSVLGSAKLKAGWNTVYFYLSDSGATNGDCDLSAINYFRIYAEYNGAALKGQVLKIDDIRMVYTGGYDYSDLSFEAYRGDNPTVDIRIEGQDEPDLAHRHDNITVAVGR
ncbi:MAG: hypothetical protein E7625_06510 [Ruminococcaceae bacterium]|nr:hypothetical protein [Oscillospiraceae bacterium]